MRRSVLIAIGAVVSAGGCLAVLLADRASAEPRRPADGVDGRVTVLEGEIAKLRSAAMLSAAAATGSSAAAHDDRSETGNRSEDAEMSEEEIVRAQRTQTESQIALLEKVIADEPVDPQWEAEVRTSVDLILENESLRGTRLGTITCRQTVCRTSLRHEDRASRDLFVENATSTGPWATSQFGTTKEEEGRLVTYVYFSREGEQLPRWNRDGTN